jgi:glutamate---cysteine ligase / carboxylate-amine ligase
VAEDAAYFGCTREVVHARTVLQRGTSADRQLKCYEKAKASGASEHEALVAVVDQLVAETAAVPGADTSTILEGENA